MMEYKPMPKKSADRPPPPPPSPPKWQTLDRSIKDKPGSRPDSNPNGQGMYITLPSVYNVPFKNYSVDTIVNIIKNLSEDDRMKIFNKFCKHCGSDDPGCQCWNDE